MATVTGFTAERMLEIENTTVVDGEVDASGDLILIQRDGTQINAGNVEGPPGSAAVTDHGLLLGLGDDDHPQYLNNARGDARYKDHGLLTGLADDDHPQYARKYVPIAEYKGLHDSVLSNLLAYYTLRGGTATATTTGTATTSGTVSELVNPFTGAGPFSVLGGASGGTVTITLTAGAGVLLDPPSTMSHARWEAFLQLRASGWASGISSVVFEMLDNTGAWVIVPCQGTWTAADLAACEYRLSTGTLGFALPNYPVRGLRVTFAVPAGQTNYLRALGLTHSADALVALPVFLPRAGGNVYGGLSLTGDLSLQGGASKVGGTIWDGLWQGMQAAPYGNTYAVSGSCILLGPGGEPSKGIYLITPGVIHLRPSGVGTDYSFTNTVFTAPGTINASDIGATNGFNCGSAAVASATDLSKHLALYGTSLGLSITSSTVNIVNSGRVYPFHTNGFNDTFQIIQANGLRVSNSTSGKAFLLRNDGNDTYFMVSDTWNGSYNGSRPMSIDMATGDVMMATNYGRTTTNGANMNFYSDTRPVRSTSSLRYKHNVRGLDGSTVPEVPYDRTLPDAALARMNGTRPNPYDILKVTPVQFVADAKMDGFYTRVGCIAENVGANAPWALSDTKDSVEWPSVTAALLQIVKDQHKVIANLETRVVALEGAPV